MSAPTRRRVVRAIAGGFAVSLAGCLGETDDEGEADDEGDEAGPGSDGLVYAFAPDLIAVIDPETGDVVDEITDGVDGMEWGDPRITHDHGAIFVTEQSRAQVLAVDTEHRSIDGEVDVGPDPLHVYNPVEGEIWAHADGEGAFYVIDTDSLEVLDVVEASLEGGGHGKLLAHEELGEKAYAANVTEPAAITVDLAERERTGEIELGPAGGAHYKAYAPETGLAYFEHQGIGTAVVDTETDEVVDELEFLGGMSLSPEETILAVLDGDDVYFLDATSEESEVLGTIEIEAGPDTLRYVEVDGVLYGVTANGESPGVTIVDVEESTIVDEFTVDEAGDGSRAGVTAGDYFVSPSSADGTVAILDVAERELVAEVDVAPGVDTVQYVGDSGVGYTGR